MLRYRQVSLKQKKATDFAIMLNKYFNSMIRHGCLIQISQMNVSRRHETIQDYGQLKKCEKKAFLTPECIPLYFGQVVVVGAEAEFFLPQARLDCCILDRDHSHIHLKRR